ncbi:MAG: hypothetical protein L0Z53_06205 [Acidobacteriales bacterium]|nr:hypothetical protein [Terriglobales bacterium]
MQLESKQVQLSLTNDAEVLEQLRLNKRLQRRGRQEIFTLQFNSVPFDFYAEGGKRNIVTVGQNVANALRRDSAVIIGNHLTGLVKAALTVVGSYSLTEGTSNLPSRTTCPYCQEEQNSPRLLARHLMSLCKSPEAGVPKFARQAQQSQQAQRETEREIDSDTDGLPALSAPPADTDDSDVSDSA